MATHQLRPKRATLHGQWRPSLSPALHIASGDRVLVSTYDVSWGYGQHPLVGQTRDKFEPRESPRDDGPCLCGPIHIAEARPGDVLAVTVESIRTADWGWTYVGKTPLNAAFIEALGLADTPGEVIRWTLDQTQGLAHSQHGQTVRMAPFFGTMGLPTSTPGWQTGWYPQRTGGNMDCKELVEGATIYFPVEVAGGLFSLGDAHASQTHGELAGSAIECPVEEASLYFVNHREHPLPFLHAHTPAGWVTFGFAPTLDEAVPQAVTHMLMILEHELKVSRIRALGLASTLVDLHITQVVNGVQGVHALLRHDALALAKQGAAQRAST